MTLAEFVIAFAENAHFVFMVVGLITFVTGFIAFVIMAVENLRPEKYAVAKSIFRWFIGIAVVSWLLFCVPSSKDLVEVRKNLTELGQICNR